jgi:hypothetical protein
VAQGHNLFMINKLAKKVFQPLISTIKPGLNLAWPGRSIQDL